MVTNMGLGSNMESVCIRQFVSSIRCTFRY